MFLSCHDKSTNRPLPDTALQLVLWNSPGIQVSLSWLGFIIVTPWWFVGSNLSSPQAESISYLQGEFPSNTHTHTHSNFNFSKHKKISGEKPSEVAQLFNNSSTKTKHNMKRPTWTLPHNTNSGFICGLLVWNQTSVVPTRRSSRSNKLLGFRGRLSTKLSIAPLLGNFPNKSSDPNRMDSGFL